MRSDSGATLWPGVVVEAGELARHAADTAVRIVDLRKREEFLRGHLPGAVHLDTRALVCGVAPATGKLPDASQLAAALSELGLTENHHVVAYDGEGGAWAARLVWTLDVLGHARAGLLNGGVDAWTESGLPLSGAAPAIAPARYAASLRPEPRITKAEIMSRLGDPALVLLDARTPEEYSGTKVRAARGGHIPGAVNLNWRETMEGERPLRLLPAARLRAMLSQRGVTPDRQVVVYCHTHHRSAHSYVMLRHLGYPDVRGYDGSWSEWGNDPGAPVEA